MDGINFDDLHKARDQQRQQVDRKRRKARLLVALLPVLMRMIRLLGLEKTLFQRYFTPIKQRTDAKAAQSFADYQPGPGDLLVCCYFKSGTHWAMQVAHQIINHGEAEFDSIYDVIPWNEAPPSGTGLSLQDPRPMQLSKTGQRVIKTHACAELVPYTTAAKYLCVIRDPKDVFVSSYHFMRAVMLGPLMPSVPTWLDLYLSDQAFWRPWADFTASYWSWRDRPNVCFLTYEQMQEDPQAMVIKIAEFLGVELNAAQLQKVLQLSSYEYMRRNDHKFHFSVGSPLTPPHGKMIRQGKKGQSSELISADQQSRIDAYCQQRLIGLGSDFPYAGHFG